VELPGSGSFLLGEITAFRAPGLEFFSTPLVIAAGTSNPEERPAAGGTRVRTPFYFSAAGFAEEGAFHRQMPVIN